MDNILIMHSGGDPWKKEVKIKDITTKDLEERYMKQNDVITIKKVLNNYFTEDLSETLIEEIIEHTDTDIDDLPIMDKPAAPVLPSLVDIITATGFLAQIAQGLAEDSDREEVLADQYHDDTFRRIAKMNRDDANALLRVRAWLNNLNGLN